MSQGLFPGPLGTKPEQMFVYFQVREVVSKASRTVPVQVVVNLLMSQQSHMGIKVFGNVKCNGVDKTLSPTPTHPIKPVSPKAT